MKTFIVIAWAFFLGYIAGYKKCENYYEPYLEEMHERIDSVWADIHNLEKKLNESKAYTEAAESHQQL